jgi:hypothetical protein
MELKECLRHLIQTPLLHAKLLNTLSFLENCGARMIAKCEHPTQVKSKMLKHAAEEFRHAHYLKQQIKKVSDPSDFENYDAILGGWRTRHYLRRLEASLSRRTSKENGYLLVTYAIEMRARLFYPLYHETLKESGSRVSVRSILLEEEEHLAEIIEELRQLPNHANEMKEAMKIEEGIYYEWIGGLTRSESSPNA